jgi:DNA adenine methylase
MTSAVQLKLFEPLELHRIVNVASVPQRSPFRYAGGKTWLVPRLRQWLARPPRPRLFIEPFAGGGILSLTVAAEGLADEVIMVELDAQVSAVWHTLLNGDGLWLADRIVSFDLTCKNAETVLAIPPQSLKEKAFQTILKNRISRGGILARGVGMLKYGENGKGIASRWYADTLKKRILAIHELRDRIAFIEGDGLAVMRQYTQLSDTAFFIDPPYTAAGKKAGRRLYTHAELDHEALFRIANTIVGDFLMTYDDAEGARELVRTQGFDMEVVAMKSTHHMVMSELLIGKNLSWARSH